MRNFYKNQKGISLVSLTIAVIIILVITGTVLYNVRTNLGVQKLKAMQSDIENLKGKVENYYLQYGTLPINTLYNGNEPIDTSINTNYINDVIENAAITNLDTGDYYVLDLSAMENITLTYGEDYQTLKNETPENIKTLKGGLLKDVYIINSVSHNIFYVYGIKYEGKTYYTLGEQEEKLENIDFNELYSQPISFNVDYQQYENNYKIFVFNIQFNGNNKNWKIQYKKENDEEWTETDKLEFFVNDVGTYNIKVIGPGELYSDVRNIVVSNDLDGDERTVYQANGMIFDGTNYINTGVCLFSEENINKDFDIEFTIDYIERNDQIDQDTILNAKYEKEQEKYPGFVVRKLRGDLEKTEISARGLSRNQKIYYHGAWEGKKITISRINNTIYYSMGNGSRIELYTQDAYKYHNTPVTFGCGLDGDGNPWRYWKGQLSNMSITLKKREVVNNPTEIYTANSLTFDGTNYVDVNTELSNKDNCNRDFEIEFTITQSDPENETLATIFNTKLENESLNYPGIYLRKVEPGFALNGNGVRNIVLSEQQVLNKKIKISRIANKIYYSIDNGNNSLLYQNEQVFSSKFTFGCSTDTDGNPWRYWKGQLSDIRVRYLN